MAFRSHRFSACRIHWRLPPGEKYAAERPIGMEVVPAPPRSFISHLCRSAGRSRHRCLHRLARPCYSPVRRWWDQCDVFFCRLIRGAGEETLSSSARRGKAGRLEPLGGFFAIRFRLNFKQRCLTAIPRVSCLESCISVHCFGRQVNRSSTGKPV